ncbi:Hint domain-containing protein [Shimia isoporae]|uniref:Hint domain-containing protein n=1 Tax=Shimia isoporae TaxID=647720 RepID=A0A4R1NLK3_9RHOB|nr:Hint domain-containing protein [Shimia isoporae]TCL09144.1 Hint domain-containing protein [Shimia isoporae]
MANYSFWALGESHVSVSGGEQLDGVTQGDGSHLVGETITLNASAWEQIHVSDGGSDSNFDDNDGNQRLDGTQTFDGVSYSNNTRIEAEYEFVLQDPNTGLTYRVLSVNFRNSSPAYGTIEGLAFVDEFPPVGVALNVISAQEGPSGGSAVEQSTIAAPPCFTPGTRIRMKRGEKPVEEIQVGDEVMTLDRGPQTVRWVGHVSVSEDVLRTRPEYRPILIRKGALGVMMPERDMMVSPQHRILLGGWRAELICGEPQVLAAAAHLVDGEGVRVAEGLRAVTYIHLQLDQHEILLSDGVPSESLNPGEVAMSSLPDESKAELRALFPELEAGPERAPARPLAYRREVEAILAVG